MNYSLHPEASEDLRNAASFYRDQAGTSLLNPFSENLNNRSIGFCNILHLVHHGADEDGGGM